jgi:hypothetical protein
VGDGYVFKCDIELLCAAKEVGADAVGDGLSLGDEFSSIKLRDNGF